MPVYDLTDKQKQVLTIIVKHLNAGKIIEPIRPVVRSESYHIEGIEEVFGRNFIWDLEALCEAKLMNQRYSRSSRKNRRIYKVTEAGHQAVANNFAFSEKRQASAEPDKETKTTEISIGDIQAIWFADSASIDQIVGDPNSIKQIVDSLAEQLLKAIEPEISSYKLVTYKKNIQHLKAQITADAPSPPTLQRLFSSLSFMENIEGSISLATVVWPYLYPLLLIAKEKIIPKES